MDLWSHELDEAKRCQLQFLVGSGLTALAVTQSVKGELNSYGEMFEHKSWHLKKKKSMLQEYEVLKIRKWQLQFTLKNMKYILCIENVG